VGEKEKIELDPELPLENKRHELYIQALLVGASQLDAYIQAGYSGKDRDSAKVSASRLLTNDNDVRQRLRHLQDQRSAENIMSKNELAELCSNVLRSNLSDYIAIDLDGKEFVKVSKEIMSNPALKGAKFRSITDEKGTPVLGIHLTGLTLEAKGPFVSALSKLMGYDAPQKVDTDAWKSIIMDIGFGTGTMPENKDIEDG